jgi:adenosylcobinamide-GDP ribazoletransferase
MPGASVRAAAGAVSFLTRVPVGRLAAIDGADVARGAVVFPLVGAGVGALSAGIAIAAHHALPAFVAAALAVAASALVTGALHLDALADTADAAGARTRSDALSIMRDSRIGPFGAVALTVDLLLKVACIAVLVERGHALGGLVAAGGLSRAASLPLAALLPYPRPEGGPGSVLTGRTSVPLAGIGVALGIGAAVVAWWDIWYWLAVTAVAVTVALGLVFRRWLGGATGDCLGAATELCETAVLVVATAFA